MIRLQSRTTRFNIILAYSAAAAKESKRAENRNIGPERARSWGWAMVKQPGTCTCLAYRASRTIAYTWHHLTNVSWDRYGLGYGHSVISLVTIQDATSKMTPLSQNSNTWRVEDANYASWIHSHYVALKNTLDAPIHMSNGLNLPRKDVAEMVIVFCVSPIVPEGLVFVDMKWASDWKK